MTNNIILDGPARGRPVPPPGGPSGPPTRAASSYRAGAAMLWAVAMVTIVGTCVARAEMPLHGIESLEPEQSRPGCQLGEMFYHHNDMWSPELEPIGVMHCIVCQCQLVIRKGVLLQKGRVNCRNIKHDCPAANCSEPVLRPGQCCKLCEGQDARWARQLSLRRFPNVRFRSNKADMRIASAPRLAQGERHRKEYLSLMVGAFMEPPSLTTAIARGHFTLDDASLYFSMQYMGQERPTQLRIVNRDGAVLYLHELAGIAFQDGRMTICGVWRGLDHDHNQLLRNGRMVVLLATADNGNGLIGGAILGHRALAKESFSAILQSNIPNGMGGVAMVTIAENGDLNFIIKMAGIRVPEGSTASITVRFMKGQRQLHESQGELFPADLEFAEVWSGLRTKESRMLARGVIDLTVVTSQGSVLRGDVTAKQTCDVLHAVLVVEAPASVRPPVTPVGSAIVTLSSDGSAHFSMRLLGLENRLRTVTMEISPASRGRQRRPCRVMSELERRDRVFHGWANGTCDKFTARFVHALLHGEMAISVMTRHHGPGGLRGMVRSLLQNVNIDKQTDPGVILSGHEMSPPVATRVGGNVWLHLDDACALHYEIVVSGLAQGTDDTLLAQLVTLPPNGQLREQRATKVTLQEFVGNMARGTISTLPRPIYEHLASGRLLLRLTTKAQPAGIMAAKLHITNRCVPVSHHSQTLGILDDQEERSREQALTNCVINDVSYDDGEVLVPTEKDDACTTCHCKRGEEECHRVVCPETDCDDPVTLEGECCPQCLGGNPSQRKCFFDGDKRWHRFGTRWHPYMPPFGFMTCAVCSCMEEGGGGVICTRRACPALECLESVAIRRHPSDCCKVCPEVHNNTQPPEVQQPQDDVNTTGSCHIHGRRYPDGATWHPRVQPFGHYACVTCRCVHSSTLCRRQTCPKLTCENTVRLEGVCCAVCDNEDSETSTIQRHSVDPF